MLSPRENSLAIYHHEQPDYYGDFMDTIRLVPDPVMVRDMIPQDGKEHVDAWGTVKVFPVDAPGAHPFLNDENIVIKDIEHWEDYLKVPSLDDLDWTLAEKVASEIDRSQYFVSFLCAAGLFERSHFLMGMEDAFCNYLEYPDEMKALLRTIADYKIKQIQLTAEHVHPDVIFYHDDWGSKQNLFLPPAVWRDMIKPLQTEIAQTIHDCGMIYMHHADCICQPVVTDMVELGIDIWQGVIPQNDIVEIQKITEGKLAMIGGIDGPAIDIENITESEIRNEVRRAIDTYCPAGRFYPAIPNGLCFREWNNSIVIDELAKYGSQWAQEHPIG
jgi:hypothetical protein